MKTPEQMAEEFFENWQPEKPKYKRPKARQYALEKITECFVAGYQAAMDQLADADKAMNSPKKLDSSDDIDLEQRVAALEDYVKVAQERILYLNQVVRLLLDNADTKKTFGGAGVGAIRTKLLDDYMEDKHSRSNKDYGSGY